MRTITYDNQFQRGQLLVRYHTVRTMCSECEHSRSWAYKLLELYKDRMVLLQSTRTGRRERAIPRHLVTDYMQHTRRGNPNWR